MGFIKTIVFDRLIIMTTEQEKRRDEAGQFVKGQSGNPGGRPKKKLWRDAIQASLSTNTEGEYNLEHIRAVSDALIIAAKAGDIQAIKEIGDRIDGKVPQGIGGDDELGPIGVQIMWPIPPTGLDE